MGKEIPFDQPLPPAIVDAMRELYAMPSDESYWAGLEARIMARVTSTPAVSWWQVLDRWVHVELVAAAAVLLVAGGLMMRANAAELRVAYDDAIAPAISETFSIPAGALGDRSGSDLQGAIFSDVISQ